MKKKDNAEMIKRLDAKAEKRQYTRTLLFEWLDVILLIVGMALISAGAFLIYIPAGFVIAGLCFLALAFFVGKKQAQRK